MKVGQFGSHRMKLRDAATWLPNHLERVDRLGATSVRTSCSCRRAGGATSRGSTSSSPSRPRDCAGRSSCASRPGCTTTCSRCSPATAPRCASTTCSSDHPWERTTDWTYVRFHGPNACERAVPRAVTAAAACARAPSGCGVARRGHRRVRLLQQRLRGARRRRRERRCASYSDVSSFARGRRPPTRAVENVAIGPCAAQIEARSHAVTRHPDRERTSTERRGSATRSSRTSRSVVGVGRRARRRPGCPLYRDATQTVFGQRAGDGAA